MKFKGKVMTIKHHTIIMMRERKKLGKKIGENVTISTAGTGKVTDLD